MEMKAYIKNGFQYFYDRNQKQWVLYPIDNLGNRIEWDKNDNPIEAQYFNNKTELNKWLNGRTNVALAGNGWVYEKVCLDKVSNYHYR